MRKKKKTSSIAKPNPLCPQVMETNTHGGKVVQNPKRGLLGMMFRGSLRIDYVPQAVLNGLFKCEYNFFLFYKTYGFLLFLLLSPVSLFSRTRSFLRLTLAVSAVSPARHMHHGRNSRQNIHMPLPSKIFRYPPARPIFFFFLSWTPPFVESNLQDR